VDPAEGPSLAAIVEKPSSRKSFGSPIKVTADDKLLYFVKFPELCQSHHQQMSVVTEMVVAEGGRLIGASTCRTTVMRVPREFQGEILLNGIGISSSVVHASLALNNCVEDKSGALPDRGSDENDRRHVGLFALYDWCFGGDLQCLRDLDDRNATYSHDHGFYLPPNAGYWSEGDLIAKVDEPHPMPGSTVGLSPAAVSETSEALRRVDRAALQTLLNRVPATWLVTNEQLECLGWFLERRATAVAGRIKQLVSN
jgi:hypothetical protein